MLALCFALSALASGAASAIPPPAETRLIQEWRDSGAPGMLVGVVRNGKLDYVKCCGWADVEKRTPTTPQTVFRIGSLTKQFTALMIMQLVQEGKLNLDQLAKSLIPNQIPDAWSAVTVRQLLNHTAGIPSYTKDVDVAALVSKSVQHEHILDQVRGHPLDFPAGSKWSYSNSGYVLLGLILEKLDSRPFEQSLKARILSPTGMNHTYFTSEKADVPHRATGYTHDSGKLSHSLYIDMNWPYAAGAMESTVGDLAKWDVALYGGKLLRPSLRDQMWQPAVLTGGKKHPYGFGWVIESANGYPVYEHAGGINGFASAIRRAPTLGLTTIVLLNSDDSEAMPIADDLMQALEPRLAVVIKPISDPDPSLTTRLRQVYDEVVAGRPDRSAFSEEMNKALSPEFLAGVASESKAWGPLLSFALVEAKDSAKGRSRVYQVVYKRSRVKATFVVDRSGLIEGAVFQPE